MSVKPLMMFTLTITTPIASANAKLLRSSQHDSLRDARAALIRYQAKRGLSPTINRWQEMGGVGWQDGNLRQGQDVVADWSISYPLAERQTT